MRSIQSFLMYLLVAAFLIGVTGCATTGEFQVIAPMSESLIEYKSLMVDVSSLIPESEEEIAQLENAVVGGIRNAGAFEKVYSKSSASPDATSDMLLQIAITDLREVNTGDRLLIGGLAGKAKMNVDMKLIDVKTGKELARAIAEGESSGGTVFAGTTPQATERTSEQIIKYVLGYK